MNDDKLEQKLQALTGALRRPDPTPEWKSDILARARREAGVIPMKAALPPRLLLAGWAAAWLAILAMNFLTPRQSVRDLALSGPVASTNAAPSPRDLSRLLAFQKQQYLTLIP